MAHQDGMSHIVRDGGRVLAARIPRALTQMQPWVLIKSQTPDGSEAIANLSRSSFAIGKGWG
ncbi:uncharacterized protein PADG_12241 [Paracoccidioides brasiliensis Pb18]|uniref:Uncharacterized protein n=2 Tax=Paracoccidioides brasiliensis TaxID=121759 RepID=A0A0A0HR44_PARBD|nr:uncharacterized protein PADG_12241 [Paracoccidioides brasiliensis Pb18]KGM91669.1 hypothetical protein PADG_12241 [Paracoccidioides brasiliensis Pb18]ODH13371.1 hypothetical protein ACO22_07321 [Paracoccidioides brasiliensis]ODH51760.1 hypothetical protein GX48_02002 [Paracoccidioides brasiliensis]